MTALPPPPPPAPPRPTGTPARRRWVVPMLAALSAVLAVALIAVSLAWRHERQRADDDADGPITVATVPATAAPTTPPPEPEPPSSLPEPEPPSSLPDLGGGVDELLDGLTGGLGDALDGLTGGLGGVSPECLGLEGGLMEGLGGLFEGEPLTGTLEEQLDELARRVQDQRGLDFEDDIVPVLLDPDEFDTRVARMVEADYPAAEADLDARVLSLLGAIPPGTDLRALQADLLAGQVAGFYDPETGDIVVRDDGDPELDANEVITLAHELDHALTDQVLGLPELGSDGGLERDSDADLAALTLVEGDATLLMQQYAIAHVSLMDQLGQLLDPQATAAEAELDDLAPFLREQLTFPYLAGLTFACHLYEQGGWRSVDAAFDNPPTRTVEVMFPGQPSAGPVDPTDLGRLASPWSSARRDTFGAAQLLWLFEAPGGDESRALDDARDLVADWTGGELELWTDGDRSALGVVLVDVDAGGLCQAVDDWYDTSFDDDRRSEEADRVVFDGGAQTAVVRCDEREVRLGIGPDRATASALVG